MEKQCIKQDIILCIGDINDNIFPLECFFYVNLNENGRKINTINILNFKTQNHTVDIYSFVPLMLTELK